ncbi:MAG: hypothetical protein JKY56_26110 [Kofleriaceae bacterium]|nr:hypothetical protein [Kofleriaceae bacterium]
MDESTRQLLIASDHATACEAPPGFNWKESMRRVRVLVPRLEQLVGQSLSTDENVQDASFFTDVACYREASHPGIGKVLVPIIAIRFSAFGNLFTVTKADDFDDDAFTSAREMTSKAGYLYVPADQLDEPYTGANPHLANTTWWTRFFDYL